LTGSSLTWNRSVTPAGRSWFLLTTLGRRMTGSGSGSSGGGVTMPIPQKHDARPGHAERDQRGQTSAGGWANLTDRLAGMLPTPTASEYGSNQGGAAGRTGAVRPSLSTMVATPRASDSTAGDRPKRADGRGPSLPAMLGDMVPTPIASDVKGSLGVTRGNGLRKHNLANCRPFSEHGLAAGLVGTEASPVSLRRTVLCALVTWLMGYPIGYWRGAATPPSRREGTRSAR